jgi:broad specificity phosphatase PhoE/NAD(P)-dependent dehydrogenase (short-subunit alcohol dehydrogenase family)
MHKPHTSTVALVAGATRGAGRGIAVELGATGAIVYVTGRTTATPRSVYDRPETIEETAELVSRAGGQGVAVVADHLDAGQVRRLVERIDREHGWLNVLVNDIWGGELLFERDKPVWEHSLERGLRLLRLAVDTHLITNHFALPLLIRHPGGLVIEMTDGTAEYNAVHYRVSHFYDLAKASVLRMAWARRRPIAIDGVCCWGSICTMVNDCFAGGRVMRIVFVRHGQDERDYRGGWSRRGLVPEGREQALVLANALGERWQPIEHLLSSDLPRAAETAAPIAAALGLPVHHDPAWRETNNGDLAGMHNDEAALRYPGLYFAALAMDEAYPGGESPRQNYAHHGGIPAAVRADRSGRAPGQRARRHARRRDQHHLPPAAPEGMEQQEPIVPGGHGKHSRDFTPAKWVARDACQRRRSSPVTTLATVGEPCNSSTHAAASSERRRSPST